MKESQHRPPTSSPEHETGRQSRETFTQLNHARIGERIMRMGSELGERGSAIRVLRRRVRASIVIFNTDPPQLGDILDMYAGPRDAESVFGHDPGFDDPEDPQAGREDWLNRMSGGAGQAPSVRFTVGPAHVD